MATKTKAPILQCVKSLIPLREHLEKHVRNNLLGPAGACADISGLGRYYTDKDGKYVYSVRRSVHELDQEKLTGLEHATRMIWWYGGMVRIYFAINDVARGGIRTHSFELRKAMLKDIHDEILRQRKKASPVKHRKFIIAEVLPGGYMSISSAPTVYPSREEAEKAAEERADFSYKVHQHTGQRSYVVMELLSKVRSQPVETTKPVWTEP